MKKLLTMAGIAAALAFCAPGAKAGIGITTNYTPLNVSIIITTNGVVKTNDDVVTQSVGKAKLDNAALLSIFSHWTTNYTSGFPKGSKLVIGWDWDEKPLVVDKTGTNVLFDADATETNYFYVEFWDEAGAESYKDMEKETNSESYTAYSSAYVELVDEGRYLPYTYFYTYGVATDKFTQNTDKEGNYTTWSLDADLGFSAYADGSTFEYLGEPRITVSASASSSGSGKGINGWWY